MNENNPLLAFSLAGEGENLVNKAVKQEPLLGGVCLKGQITTWYARPNTGKTLITLALIIESVESKSIKPEDVFYINADDSQAGYAEKVQLLDEYRIHTLVPGEKGFKLNQLVPALNKMAEQGTASGKLVVVDTVKKIADLMDKREMRHFGMAIRPFTMAGGTILLLAHTNKARSAKGELVYAGTSDLLEDADCAYLIDEAPDHTAEGKKLVRFMNLKLRGSNVEQVLYQYDVGSELSYFDRLLSVEPVSAEHLNGAFREDDSEENIKQHLAISIRHSENPKKMAIIKLVAKLTKSSRRRVCAVLDEHTADDPTKGLWAYEVQARGAHIFRLHPAGEACSRGQPYEVT
jgi:AAA domain